MTLDTCFLIFLIRLSEISKSSNYSFKLFDRLIWIFFMFWLHRHLPAKQDLNSKQSAKGHERIIREILRRSDYFSYGWNISAIINSKKFYSKACQNRWEMPSTFQFRESISVFFLQIKNSVSVVDGLQNPKQNIIFFAMLCDVYLPTLYLIPIL